MKNKEVKRMLNKMTAVALSACMIVGSGALAGCGSSASADESADAAVVKEESADAGVASGGFGEGVAYKDEKVYVVTDGDGSVSEVTVSDWLQNEDNYATLIDKTNLSDVVNVKGNEEISVSNGKLTIDAEGNDIYYQGTSNEELPLDMTITYKLDGKEISANELEGASGKLEINIAYTDNAVTQVNGKSVTVPFLAVEEMMVSSDKFSNVEVSGGKVMTNGDNVIVIGYAMPGLADAVDTDALSDVTDTDLADKIPSEITITADVEDCEIDSMMGMYSASMMGELFEKVEDESDSGDDEDEVKDDIDELSDAAKKLDDGTSELSDGASELSDGAKSLADGTSKLLSGSEKLAEGTDSLNTGAATLSSGAATLSEGTTKLASGAKELDTGAASLAAGLKELDTGLNTASTGADSLKTATAALSTGISGMKTTLDDNASAKATEAATYEAIAKKYQGAAQALLQGLSSGSTTATATAYTTAQTLNTNYGSYMSKIDASSATAIAGLYTQIGAAYTAYQNDNTEAKTAKGVTLSYALLAYLDNSATLFTAAQYGSYGASEALKEVSGSISTVDATTGYSLVGAADAVASGASELSTGLSTLATGADTAYAGATKLAEGATSLDTGAEQLSSGASDLASGAKKLSKGAGDLDDGADTLYSGTKTLDTGAGKLSDGAQSLADGASELSDGMSEFKSEGIDEITDKFGDILDSLDGLSDVSDAAQAYKTFTGLGDGQDGEVSFIVKTF